MRNQHAAPLAVAIVLTCLSGCGSLDMGLIGPGTTIPRATPYNPATEVVCLWQPGEGIGLDGLPTRGFAGQILFFTPAQPEPVQVDGDVRIYVFDDLGTPEEQSRPIHQFDFSADAWNTYLRKTNVGAAYQVFIPYTRKGGYAADCVLRVRLAPENGLPAYSKMSSVHLPGPGIADHDDTSPPDADDVRTVDAETGSAALPAFDNLALQIDAIDVTHRQPALLSLQRTSPPPNTRGLESAIAKLLRERESPAADDDSAAFTDGGAVPNEPLTGHYNLSPRADSEDD